MADRRAVFFIHIPKTGGTTLQAVLENGYPSRLVCPAQIQPEFELIPEEKLAQYRLFAGHYWGLLEKLPEKPIVIAWLRKPLPRAVSMYKHILRDPGHGLHKRAKYDEDFNKLVQFPALRNAQVRHLARNHQEYSAKMADEECLDLAQRIIDEASFVGFTENLENSARALLRFLGWDADQAIPHLNRATNVKGSPLDEERMVLLAEANQLDEVLYEYAWQRWGAFQ